MTGLVLGLAGALSLTRVLRNHLYEVGPADPATFVTVAFLLAGVALSACVVPAYPATKVDRLWRFGINDVSPASRIMDKDATFHYVLTENVRWVTTPLAAS